MGLTVLEVVTTSSFERRPAYNQNFIEWAHDVLYMQFHGQSVIIDLDHMPAAFVRQLYKATRRGLDGSMRSAATERALKDRIDKIRRFMRPHPLIQLAKCAE